MKNRALFVLTFGLLLLASQAFSQSYSLLSLDVSCDAASAASECPTGLTPGQVAAQTAAKGINARGDIVGSYVGSDNKTRGFLLKDGLNSLLAGGPLQFSTIEFPAAGVRSTSANGINPQGEIVGSYVLPVKVTDDNGNLLPEDSPLYCPPNLPNGSSDPACSKSFYYARGTFITVMFPATIDPQGNWHTHPGATVESITADGAIYGCLHDHDLGMSMHGAVWQRYNGKGGQQTVVPAFTLTAGGGELGDSMDVPMSMNNGGSGGGQTIVGFLVDMNSHTHGYRVQGGVLQQYDAFSNSNLTAIWGINPSQQFVGTYRLAGEVTARRHGYMQPARADDGTLPAAITIDYPGAFSNVANAINPDGVVVGQYAYVLSNGITAGPLHGFLAVPPAID